MRVSCELHFKCGLAAGRFWMWASGCGRGKVLVLCVRARFLPEPPGSAGFGVTRACVLAEWVGSGTSEVRGGVTHHAACSMQVYHNYHAGELSSRTAVRVPYDAVRPAVLYLLLLYCTVNPTSNGSYGNFTQITICLDVRTPIHYNEKI